MSHQYTQEQIDKILEKLPEELQEAIFSVETAQEIGQVGDTYGITDERLNRISEYVGFVLMGLILPQEFSGMLEKEIELPKTLAEAIARDLNRLVFYPVKPALEQLHQMEIKVEAKVVTPAPEENKQPPKEESEEGNGPDSYREPIE